MKHDDQLKVLNSRLNEVTQQFEQQMRARGFDPEQAENVALPAPLARLYIERQWILEELAQLTREGDDDGDSKNSRSV
jgi:hypothetical protein